MKIFEYQKAVRRTINNELDTFDRILNFSLGLSGEIGEVIDLIKKEFFQGHKRNNDKLKEEIGDVFWYLINLCDELGYDIETILDINIEKLKKRYPNGFKKEDSESRYKKDSDFTKWHNCNRDIKIKWVTYDTGEGKFCCDFCKENQKQNKKP